MTIKTVVVAGAGVLGSQIAFQNAYYGKQVWVYDIKDEFLDRAKGNMEHYQTIYSNYFQTPEQAKEALTRLHYTTDLKQAVADADLVIEAVPEVLTIKQNLFKQLGGTRTRKNDFSNQYFDYVAKSICRNQWAS